jgi:hypothetical protein
MRNKLISQGKLPVFIHDSRLLLTSPRQPPSRSLKTTGIHPQVWYQTVHKLRKSNARGAMREGARPWRERDGGNATMVLTGQAMSTTT